MRQFVSFTLYNRKTEEQVRNLTFNSLDYDRVTPFFGVALTTGMDIVTFGTLYIGNPPAELAKGLINQVFSITIGYEGLNGDTSNQAKVFVGQCVQQPYFTEQNNGTDQILNIPLIVSSTPYDNYVIDIKKNTDKLEDALKQCSKNLVWSQKAIEMKANTVTQDLHGQRNNFSDIDFINHFRNEQIQINIYPNGMWYIYSLSESVASTNVSSTQTGDKIKGFEIYNQAYVPSEHINIVPTAIKSKYAVIGLDGTFDIDLACVIPQAINCSAVVIENLGKNINIYETASNSSNLDTTSSGGFIIRQQNVRFDTYGTSVHQLRLIQNKDSALAAAQAQMIAQRKDTAGNDNETNK